MMTIEEKRKAKQRANLLLILFFCLLIGSLVGAVGYHHKLKTSESKLRTSENRLSSALDSLEYVNGILDSVRKELENLVQNQSSFIHLDSTSNQQEASKLKLEIDSSKKAIAKKYETEGYYQLNKGYLWPALEAFQSSEKVYNGYHQVYELSRYLNKNKNDFGKQQRKQEILAKIRKDYCLFGPSYFCNPTQPSSETGN